MVFRRSGRCTGETTAVVAFTIVARYRLRRKAVCLPRAIYPKVSHLIRTILVLDVVTATAGRQQSVQVGATCITG